MLGRQIVFYDSECATCHGLVRFILNRGPVTRERFRFLPTTALKQANLSSARDSRGLALSGDSIVTLRNGLAYQKADAIFTIIHGLGFPWSLLLVFRLLPLFLLNPLYDLFARHRYRFFGKANPKALCEVPDTAVRKLFLQELPSESPIFPYRAGAFLGAEWVNLVFLNYVIPEELLKPYLPEGTELDLWQGQALASIVAFQMQQTLVLGHSVPGHEDFEEVNLRFYVLRHAEGANGPELRRGVVFIKEIVPRHAIAWVARVGYNENYVARRMSHRHEVKGTQSTFEYRWQSPEGECVLKASLSGEPEPSKPGSLEEFITEHYWGYAKQRDGSTVEYEVEHPRWPVWTQAQASLDGPMASDYGSDLAQCLQNPISICAARGSAVRVFGGKRIERLRP